jgi:hypothetical protein
VKPSTRPIFVGAWMALVAAAGCGRAASGGAEPAGSSSAGAPGASGAPAAGGSGAASAAGSASSGAAGRPPRAWHGSYKTAAAAVPVPSDWAKIHWSSADGTTGVGDGAIDLLVDGATGATGTTYRVTGSLDGAAGVAVIEGTAAGDTISASVRRKDPTDRGLAGTLVAKTAGDSTTGTLSLASGDGSIVRTGTFTLAPAGAPASTPAPAPAPATAPSH